MNRKRIDYKDYAPFLLNSMKEGLLLTAKAEDKVNPMVIGWGSIGICWRKPVFTVYVREGRFTRLLLDKNPEFTISAPMNGFDRKILTVCGTESGRHINKIQMAGLTLIEAEKISVPAILEFPLTLECRVMYRQKQDLSMLEDDVVRLLYPQNVESSYHSANRDAHITYVGEIVSSYVLERE